MVYAGELLVRLDQRTLMLPTVYLISSWQFFSASKFVGEDGVNGRAHSGRAVLLSHRRRLILFESSPFFLFQHCP